MKSVSVACHLETVGKKDLPVFYYAVEFGDARIEARAGISQFRSEKPDEARTVLGFVTDGDRFSVKPAAGGKGFVVVARGKDGAEALKEAVRNLYRVLVEEKVLLAEINESVGGYRVSERFLVLGFPGQFRFPASGSVPGFPVHCPLFLVYS